MSADVARRFDERRRLHVERNVAAWHLYVTDVQSRRRAVQGRHVPPCRCAGDAMDMRCAAALATELLTEAALGAVSPAVPGDG